MNLLWALEEKEGKILLEAPWWWWGECLLLSGRAWMSWWAYLDWQVAWDLPAKENFRWGGLLGSRWGGAENKQGQVGVTWWFPQHSLSCADGSLNEAVWLGMPWGACNMGNSCKLHPQIVDHCQRWWCLVHQITRSIYSSGPQLSCWWSQTQAFPQQALGMVVRDDEIVVPNEREKVSPEGVPRDVGGIRDDWHRSLLRLGALILLAGCASADMLSDGFVDARPVKAGSGTLLAPCDTLVSCMDVFHELVTKFLQDEHTSPFQDQPILNAKFVMKGPEVMCRAVSVTVSGWEPCRYVLHEMAQYGFFPGGSSQLFQSGRAKLH